MNKRHTKADRGAIRQKLANGQTVPLGTHQWLCDDLDSMEEELAAVKAELDAARAELAGRAEQGVLERLPVHEKVVPAKDIEEFMAEQPGKSPATPVVEDVRWAVEREWKRLPNSERKAGSGSRLVLCEEKRLQVKINGVWQDIKQEIVKNETDQLSERSSRQPAYATHRKLGLRKAPVRDRTTGDDGERGSGES
jgi:hypothetical protein